MGWEGKRSRSMLDVRKKMQGAQASLPVGFSLQRKAAPAYRPRLLLSGEPPANACQGGTPAGMSRHRFDR